MMTYDREIWLREKGKRCAHFKKRKLPTALLKYWRVRGRMPEVALDELRSKLLYIEETFAIEPDIRVEYDSNEEIIGYIKGLESPYQIILHPIQSEKYNTFFSLYLFRDSCASVMISLHILLESLGTDLWETLVGNPPPLSASAKTNVEWFMRQSRGIKVCLDQFYRARSYGKAYGYLIAVYSFMENIYHFIHRLHIAELSTKPPSPHRMR